MTPLQSFSSTAQALLLVDWAAVQVPIAWAGE